MRYNVRSNTKHDWTQKKYRLALLGCCTRSNTMIAWNAISTPPAVGPSNTLVNRYIFHKKYISMLSYIYRCSRTREKRERKKKQADTFEWAERIKAVLPTAFNPARSCRIRPLATNMLRKRKNTGFWYIRQYIYINRNGLVHVLVCSSLYGDCSCTRREDWREEETIVRKVAQSGNDSARRSRVPNARYRWST